MTGPRRRVICPVCGRSVAVTQKGRIGPHTDPDNPKRYRCEAAGKLTAEDVRRSEIAQLAALISRYPQEARNFVDWL